MPAGVDSGDGVAPELKQKGYELQVCGGIGSRVVRVCVSH